nr:sigma factor-like helix-turn-helix DNA-binding protein [Holdemania filiformis]
MTIEQATLEREIDQAYAERQLLGLDAWLNSLSRDDRQIIRLVFEDGYSYQAAAPMVNLSRSGIDYRINVICKSQDASS